MSQLQPDQLISALRWRYATKQFDPARKIPEATWSALEEALVLTPSSFGLQPWKFLVVRDPALREQLVPYSWRQRQVVDASHLVVMTVMTRMTVEHIDKYLQDTARTRQIPVQSLAGFRSMMIGDVIDGARGKVATEWAIRQAYIALGNLMTAAALLGIDTCPMEGFEAAKYDEILGLTPRGLTTAVLCPIGYRLSTDKYASLAKVRFSKAEVIEYR